MFSIIHTAKLPEDLADKFCEQLIIWINETQENVFHIALSGGKTPLVLFSLLAEKYENKVQWQKIHFWWVDERMVHTDDSESNFGVADRLLFSKIGVPQSQIHRIKGENEPYEEAKQYGAEIISQVPIENYWPAFDLILLGMGDDGHTASIFPDQVQLMDSSEITAIAIHPVTGQKRITLTGRVINNARRVAFLVTGVSKSAIFNEIIEKSPDALRFPASHIRPKEELHWFIDEEVWKRIY